MKADLAAVTSFLYIKRKHKSDRCHCHKWNARQFVVDDKIFESTKSNRSVAWRRVINWMFPTSIHLELLQTNEVIEMVTKTYVLKRTRDWSIWVGCVHHLRYYNNTKRYIIFFKKNFYVIPSVLASFLPNYSENYKYYHSGTWTKNN